jgi:hypothetical protein
MSTNRESLLDKMRALLAKTRKNGCTESEELAALVKVRAMRDAYCVTDDELQLTKNEEAVLREEAPDQNDPHKIKWWLACAVAQFCDCKVWRVPSGGFMFCGMESDVQWASWLLDHLTDFVSSGDTNGKYSKGMTTRWKPMEPNSGLGLLFGPRQPAPDTKNVDQEENEILDNERTLALKPAVGDPGNRGNEEDHET